MKTIETSSPDFVGPRVTLDYGLTRFIADSREDAVALRDRCHAIVRERHVKDVGSEMGDEIESTISSACEAMLRGDMETTENELANHRLIENLRDAGLGVREELAYTSRGSLERKFVLVITAEGNRFEQRSTAAGRARLNAVKRGNVRLSWKR